jgi:predicted transcriptional regulator
MSTVTIELTLDESLLKEIDDIAAFTERTRDQVIQQALKTAARKHREYMEKYVAMVEEGIVQADAGMFASDEEVKAVFARYGVMV